MEIARSRPEPKPPPSVVGDGRTAPAQGTWAAGRGEERPRPRRRLLGPSRRRRDDRLVGGVAAALSRRIGVDVTVVRLALVLCVLLSGVGAAAYMIAWLVLPYEEDAEILGRVAADRRGIALALALTPLLAMTLILASALHLSWLSTPAWTTFVCLAGMILVFRNACADERAWIKQATHGYLRAGSTSVSGGRGLALRLVAGAALGVAGLTLFDLHRARRGLGAVEGVVLVLAAVVVVFGPWWLHLAQDLASERQARIRAEARADLAARVHDSVLQTLAMIQRDADHPHKVAALARAQERELRSWLFESRTPPAADQDRPADLGAALGALAREVEDAYEITVEVVNVGTCALDADLAALIAAGREAAVNAAKWSGAPAVSVFAEVEPGRVSLFVRDRGKGFDPAAVADDRRGVAESIRGRMARHGGRADIRSTPGGGTEVALSVPRRPARS